MKHFQAGRYTLRVQRKDYVGIRHEKRPTGLFQYRVFTDPKKHKFWEISSQQSRRGVGCGRGK